MKGRKRDRLARLLYVEHLFFQNHSGFTFKELARLCDVSERTARRDVKELEQELHVPIWEEKGRRGISEGYFLPPISFSLPEAMTIFLASRLLLSYSNAYNPSISYTFNKLNSVIPEPLRGQIRKTIEWMQIQKKDQQFLFALEMLSRAWTSRHKVRIKYWTLGEKAITERIVEPYFIQPAALEHANYLIAYCHKANCVRTFKIERIKGIEILAEQYEVPQNFDANEYLGTAWGISVYGKVEEVILKFSPDLARIAQETMWHPSQATQMQLDGSAIVTMKLPVTVQFETFVLGWGGKVEVLQPAKLRKRILKIAQAITNNYKAKG